MRIEDLVIFTDVVRYHSMNIASEKHFMSPQNLSKIIRNIENELDVVLFKRSKKGSELTEEGERFYFRVQKILKEYDKALEEIHHMERWSAEEQQIIEKVKIKVLCNQGATNYAVLNAYHALQEKKIYDVRLDLNLMDVFEPSRLSDCIHEDYYDIVVCGVQENDLEVFLKKLGNYILVYVFQDEFVLLISKNHLFADREKVSLSELKNSKLILAKNSYVYDNFFAYGEENKIISNSLNTVIEQVEYSDEFYTLICKSLIGLNSMMKSNSLLMSIPLEEKIYGFFIVLLHENVSEKKAVRGFVKEIVANFSATKSY